MTNTRKYREFRLLKWLERVTELLTLIVAVIGAASKILEEKDPQGHIVSHLPQFLERSFGKLEALHYGLIIFVGIVLSAILYVIRYLARNLQDGMLEQAQKLAPHLWLVTAATHRELNVFSSDFVTLSGAFVNAIGSGKLDYRDPPFVALLEEHSRHYSEFLYYWLIETVLYLKANSVKSLKMMHYLPPGGLYPIFIRRFQQAQRRMPADAEILKIYRFRSKEDYDQDEFAAGVEYKRAGQIQWSQLLMEDAVRAKVLVDHGCATVKYHDKDNVCEIMLIEFKNKWRPLNRGPIDRLIAIAEKDPANFEFRSGRIILEPSRV